MEPKKYYLQFIFCCIYHDGTQFYMYTMHTVDSVLMCTQTKVIVDMQNESKRYHNLVTVPCKLNQ